MVHHVEETFHERKVSDTWLSTDALTGVPDLRRQSGQLHCNASLSVDSHATSVRSEEPPAAKSGDTSMTGMMERDSMRSAWGVRAKKAADRHGEASFASGATVGPCLPRHP